MSKRIVSAPRGANRRRAVVVLAGAVASVFGSGAPVFAGNYYWDGNNNANWGNTAFGTNWSSSLTTLSDPGTTPGFGGAGVDNVFFTFPGDAGSAGATIVDTPVNINSLTFNTNASSPIGIGGSNTLTIGTGGLTVVTGTAGPETLSTNVAIGGTGTWANNATSASLNTVTISGILSGSSALTLQGTGSTITPSGSFIFQNANTYSGALSLLNANTSLTLNSNVAGTSSGTLLSAASIALGGGTSLILDNTNAAATRLGSSLPVTSTGGSISLVGNSGSAVSESIGTLTIGTGATNISVTPNGQATTLTINNLARDVGNGNVSGTTIGTLGGTVNFAPGSATAVVSLPNQAAGFIGPWATVGVENNTGNLDFATVSAGVVAPLSTYNTGAFSTWTTTTDAKNSTTQTLTAASNPTIHSFYSTTAGILNVNANTLTISSGGIIANGGTGPYVVNGNQTMQNASVLGGTGFSAGASDIVAGSKITVAAGVPDFVFNVSGNSAITNNGTVNISTGVLQVNASLADGPSPSGLGAATTMTGSNIVTLATGSTSLLYPGVTVTGLTGLSGTQTVTSVINGTQFTVASNATTGGSATPAFTSHTGLTKTGGGLLDLANGNNGGDGNAFSGPITVNGGTILVRADADFGAAPSSATPNAITLNGGEIRSTAGFAINANRGITVGPQGGTLSYDGGGTFTATSMITGVGGMNFESISNQGATTFQLRTAAGGLTYQGPTSLVTKTVSGQAASVLIFEIAQELPSSTPLTIASFENTYGTVNMNSLGQTVGSLSSTGIVGTFTPTITNISNLTIGGTSGSPVNQSATYAGTMSGANLTKNGGGVQTFSNANTYSGTTTVNGGTLLVTNTTGSATGTSTVTVNSGALLGGNGIISGAVTVNSGGTLAPAVSPGSASTLQLNGGVTLNAGSLLNFNLGAVNTGTNPITSPTSDNVYLGAAGTLKMTTGGTDTINVNALGGFTNGTYHLISATAANGVPASLSGINFVVNGPDQFLYSVSDNTGGDDALDLTVTPNPNPSLTWVGAPGNGTWNTVNTNTPWKTTGGANTPQAYADGANLTFDNTPGGVNSAISISPSNVTPGSMTFNNNFLNNYTFSGASITGSTGLTMIGNGTVTFNNVNTFTGTASVQTGTLVVGSTGALADAAFNISAAGALNVNGTLAATTITNAGTLTVGSTATIPAASTLSNSNTATFNNASQTLAGLTGAGSLVLNGTALTVGGGTSVYSGVISGATASLTVNNGASLTLSNANTYGSGTTVSGGTLAVSNTTGSGTGAAPVAVNSGGILGGSGSIAGPVTLSAIGTGHLQPSVVSGVPTTLTVNNNLTLNAGSVLDFGFSAAPSSDSVQVNGNLTLAAGADTLNMGTLGFGASGGTYELFGFTGTLSDNATFTINGVPAGDTVSLLTPNQTGGVAGELVLSVAVGPAIKWTGAAGTSGAGAWDTTSMNWATPTPTPTAFSTGTAVTFDNTGSFPGVPTTITVVAGGVAPGNMTFNNGAITGQTATPYTITGGPIAGSGSLTLTPTAGQVTLSGANSFNGGVNVNGGQLLLENNTAAGTGPVAVNAGLLSVGSTAAATALTIANPITVSGSTIGTVQNLTGSVTLSGMLTAASGTTSTIEDFDPVSGTYTADDILITGPLAGSGTIIVPAVPGDPRDNTGVRFRGSGSTFSGTIMVQNSTKFELQVNGTTGSPIGTGNVVFQAGTYVGPGSQGTFPVVNIRNSSGGNATPGNNFTVTGTGAVFFNQLTGAAGSTSTWGNLKVGGSGVNQTILTGANAVALQTMIFPTVTTEGGSVTFSAGIPGNTDYVDPDNFSLGPIAKDTSVSPLPTTSLTFNSTSTVTLKGVNTYGGSTTVGAAGGGTGTLLLGVPGSLPAGTALTVNSGTVDFNNGVASNNQTVASLAGSGGIITNSDATNQHTFTVNQSTNTTYSGAINGNLALITSGGGTLVLAGSSAYTGPTTITGGTLSVTGSLGATAVTVNPNGILAGRGTLGGSVTYSGSATLAPSAGLTAPIGHPLTITGPLALTSASTYSVILASPTAGTNPTGYDQVDFGGTVNLASANLVINDTAYLAGSPNIGDQFWIMDGTATNTTAGQLSGQFAEGSTINGGGVTYSIAYDVPGDPDGSGNDALLTVTAVPEPASIGLLGLGSLGLLARRRRRARV